MTRGGFYDELPSKAASSALVKGRKWRREGEFWNFLEGFVGLLDFGKGGFFGFVSDGEPGEVSEWW